MTSYSTEKPSAAGKIDFFLIPPVAFSQLKVCQEQLIKAGYITDGDGHEMVKCQ